MKKPRIGIVGGGKFGEIHLKACAQLQREGRAELCALADVDARVRESRAREFGVRTYENCASMLAAESLDAITIATPDFLHREIALTALAAGKHVLVEKPMDTTVEGCEAMIEAADKRGLLLQVDYHKRYDPYHQELERKIRAGELGRVQYGYAHVEDRIDVPRDWFPHWAPRSSPAWFIGIHMYDLVRWCIKAEAKAVFATGTKDVLKSLGIDTYDSIRAHIVFKNGASFAVDSSWILPDKFEAIVNQGIRVVGSAGMMEVDSQYRGSLSCTTAAGMATQNLGFLREERERDGSMRYAGYGIEAIQDFVLNVAHLMEGGSMRDLGGVAAFGRDGLEATKIAVAAHRSVATGELVDIT